VVAYRLAAVPAGENIRVRRNRGAFGVLAALVCVLSVGLGGWLFWKLVRVMGRMQAGEREHERDPNL